MSPDKQDKLTIQQSQRRFVVEVCQSEKSGFDPSGVEWVVKKHLVKQPVTAQHGKVAQDPLLWENVADLKVYDSKGNPLVVNSENMLTKEDALDCFVYRLHDDQPEDELLDDQEEELPAATHWMLPSKCFVGYWDTLIYDTNIKQRLLNYASTSLHFAERGVDQNLVSWNRVILLHGPPGTGKTSLCHALAQKLSIRLSNKFNSASLLEVNSHSLFSKWFSESGKLVMKMFKKVEELLEDEKHLVCLLIDEVESLAAARAAVSGGTDPSDAIRVVNALLTQIDRLKRYKNVLILTTSNITGKIDLAFVDRADIKVFIDFPSAEAIYSIFRSCLDELARTGIIKPKEPIYPDPTQLSQQLHGICANSLRLWAIAQSSVGLSGRTLRKLPFLAHAGSDPYDSVSQKEFLDSLADTVKLQFEERKQMTDAE